MDIRKVKKLIELLEESNINEIEIKEGEESVRISRNTTTHSSQHHTTLPSDSAVTLSSSSGPTETTPP